MQWGPHLLYDTVLYNLHKEKMITIYIFFIWHTKLLANLFGSILSIKHFDISVKDYKKIAFLQCNNITQC